MLIVAGCADASGPGDSRLGRYRLARINGSELPGVVVQNAAVRLEFLSGALRLNADDSFTDSTSIKRTELVQGAVTFLTDVASGTYRISQDTVYFDSVRPGEEYFMVFQAAGSLTQQLGGSILVYRK